MNLTKTLRDLGYDLIEGPVRNHKPLQLWLKRSFDEAELYYESIDHAFKSDVELNEITTDALTVNSSTKNDYSFNIGITLLEDILKSLGLGAFNVSAKIQSGYKVTISYDNSITKEYAIGNIINYLSSADFVHPNPILLKNANRNNILLITGAIFAKNLIVEIETDFTLDSELLIKLNNAGQGNLDFSKIGQNVLKMTSSANMHFPIAVKASRIDFDRGKFSNLNLIGDNRNFF